MLSYCLFLPLGMKQRVDVMPIYVLAEDRVLKINPLNVGSSETAVELFFGSEYERVGDIVGLAVSISSSCVLINVKNRGLFAYRLQGKLYWSVGPVLYQHGYRQGCRKNITECYFSSVPVIDHCEASIYVRFSYSKLFNLVLCTKLYLAFSKPFFFQLQISNNQGEIYALSTRSPHFKWIQDFSSFGSTLTMKAGNNGLLYVTEATKALILAVDVSRGSILWQKSFGPLSMEDYAPAVDFNGWISIGSLDGYLYSFSPKGVLKKFPIVLNMHSVIQVSPVLDCSGYAIYASQTQTEGKVTRIIGDYTYISAMKPKGVIFTLTNPATGIIFWSEQYPGNYPVLPLDPKSSSLQHQWINLHSNMHPLFTIASGRFSLELLKSDLQYFLLDESILLAFFAASSEFLHNYQCSLDNHDKLPSIVSCQMSHNSFASGQKFALSCSQVTPENFSTYTGNKKTILLFLIFESIILLVLAITVRFCYMFWKKKKLQNQHLGKFLDKRRSLRLQKKVFDRSITELQQKAAEEAIANDMLEKMGNLVKQRENIERKLSTSYSLGRDEIGSHSPSLLPLSDRKTRSFSFQGAKKESITLFHTVSDTSSETSWSEWDSDTNISEDEDEIDKGKSPIEIFSSSDDEIYQEEYQSTTPSSFASTSRQVNEIEEMKPGDQEDSVDHPLQNRIRKRKSY
uniref:Protein GAMETE EXPRESSED 3 n=1 Tax=Solanum lycopersicum TaxID=4081 RepID=A0A3Q7FJQ7_SOLLC